MSEQSHDKPARPESPTSRTHERSETLNRVDIHGLFKSLQQRLSIRLETGRQVITHSGSKGAASELGWREVISSFLPPEYSTAQGFVINPKGYRSDQIDIIIFDRNALPLVFDQDGVQFVPVESVSAVFEVKQEANAETVKYAGEKAASVRRLLCGSDQSRSCKPGVLAGLLCLAKGWSSPMHEALLRSLVKLAFEQRLDLGCVLQDGAFAFSYFPNKRWSYTTSGNEAAISYFLSVLLSGLREVGAEKTMDLSHYFEDLTLLLTADDPRRPGKIPNVERGRHRPRRPRKGEE